MRTADAPERAPVPEAEAADERARILAGLRYCTLVFLGLRVGVTVLALAGVAMLPGLDPVGVPGWPARAVTPGWHNAVTAFERFDALWFLRIASEGYRPTDGSAVFFPGYPLMIRGLSFVLGGRPLAAALAISNLAAFGSMVVLYFLSASEWDVRVARRAVLYLAVFPTSFFLLAPYSEAPFLLFVLVSLWGARRNRWWIAGAAGAAAALTRNVGVLIVLPLFVEAIRQAWAEEARLGPRLAWAVMPAVGTLAYLAFWLGSAGESLAPIQQQATWQRVLTPAPITVIQATRIAFRFVGHYPGGYHLMDWLIVIPGLVAAGWAAARSKLLYGVYTWAMILAPLTFIFPDRPFMSFPRFLLPIFPILWAPAVLARGRPGLHGAVVGISAAALGVLFVLFVNWYYVF